MTVDETTGEGLDVHVRSEPSRGSASRPDRRPAPGQLQVVVVGDRDRLEIILRGELDIASAEGLRSELDRCMASPTGRVLIDLRDLEFIDSTGLRTLIEAWERGQKAGCEMSMRRGGPAVRRVFELTGSDEYFSFE